MPTVSECAILAHQQVAPGHLRLAVQCPKIARDARPGQFAMIQVADSLYPFLRRPMSFERIFEDGVTFLYKVEGEGTRLLARLTPSQTVSVQGPLGNGWPVECGFKRHILVAGGIGVAPFPALAEKIKQMCGKMPEVILGARSRDCLLCENDFRRMGCTVHVATDDGTAGKKAFATQVLADLAPGPGTRLYACGPMAMMEATSLIAEQLGVDCQVSLEAQMACGTGACLGCVVEARRELEGEKMVRVCAEGPVFNAAMIDWNRHRVDYDR
ncbi:MAG TPA: dihydroorotate dehydrogenase electron transfer subunit [Candidatus Bathyarchaeia archaeon]|nr:dihydroorotate dehydrogenase electron transfer subunit [Candidatus Bathyarchaeia archaeon]